MATKRARPEPEPEPEDPAALARETKALAVAHLVSGHPRAQRARRVALATEAARAWRALLRPRPLAPGAGHAYSSHASCLRCLHAVAP